MGLLGIDEEVIDRSAASLAGEMKLLKTGFYSATVKRAGTYKNAFKSKSFFAEVEVDGETKMISGSLKNKNGKTAEHIVAMVVEISTAADVELGEEADISSGKVKDYGTEYSAKIFDELSGTEIGLICVLSYNEDDDFKFRENLTICQPNGENAKGESLKEKLEDRMEDMEEFEGYLATKRNAKKKSSKSRSSDGESSGDTKASAAKI